MRTFYTTTFALTVLATAIQSQVAMAESGFLEEVIITATKQATTLQDTAIAVTAFSDDELNRAQISNALDIQMSVPNMLMSKGNFTSANVSIRGIGLSAVGPAADSGTGIHINGVYINNGRIFESEFYDTERVEVLRGPQGTLYGRNTTAGVVNVITKKADDEFGGSIDLQLGNYNTVKFKGAVNIPITGNLSTRLSAFSLDRDGYTENVYDGSDIDDRDMYSLRWSTEWLPGDDTSVSMMAQYFKEDDSRMRGQKQACRNDPDGVLGCLPGGLEYETTNSKSTITGYLLGLVGAFGGGTFPADDYANTVNPSDRRKVNMDFNPTYEADETIVSFELTHQFDDLTLSSLTGYHKAYFNARNDYDMTVASEARGSFLTMELPEGYAPISTDRNYGADTSSSDPEQWSQEFRLTSSYDGDWNFLLGGFWLTYENENSYYVFNSGLAAFGQWTQSPGAAPFLPIFGLPGPLADNVHLFHNNTRSYELDTTALFGELYWEISDNMDATFGLRYTDEEKASKQRTIYLGFISDPTAADGDWEYFGDDWQETTGKFNLNYHTSDETMLYGTLSRSYKSGGFNPIGGNSVLLDPVVGGDPGLASFEPEYIDALEVGVKTRLFDNRLQANITAFYYDYEGLQVSKIVEQTSLNENVDASITGLEGEFIFAPDEHWLVSLNVALLDTEINEFSSVDPADPNQMGTTEFITSANGNTDSRCGCAGVEAVLDGNKLQQAPEYSINLSINYAFTLDNGMGVSLGTTYYKQDEFYARIYNTANDTIDSWSVWHATAMLSGVDEDWFAELFVKNLQDEDHITGQYLTDAVSGLFTNQFILEPRTYGVNIGYRF